MPNGLPPAAIGSSPDGVTGGGQNSRLRRQPVVLSCRKRRRSDAYLALGGSWVAILGTPQIAALFLTLPLVFIAVKQKVPPPILVHPVWGPVLGGWFVASSVAIYIFFFTAPQSTGLVLHENGFRYKKRFVPFSNLAQVSVGRLYSGLEETLLKINRIAGQAKSANRSAVQMAQNSAEASLTVTLKGGSPFCMKNVLVEYEVGDLEQVLQKIQSKLAERGQSHN